MFSAYSEGGCAMLEACENTVEPFSQLASDVSKYVYGTEDKICSVGEFASNNPAPCKVV